MTHQPAPHADRDHSEEPGCCICSVPSATAHDCSQTPQAHWVDVADLASVLPSTDVRSRHVVGDGPSIVGMVDSFGRPATVFTPPEDLRRDPARWPTPEEFVTEWEQYTPAQRLQLAERVIADGQAVAAVALLAHRLDRAEADRDALRTEVERIKSFAERGIAAEADAVRQVEAERDEVAGRLSALLCDLTGGRLSKPTYDVPTMVQEIEEHLTRTLEVDAVAERDALRAEVGRLKAAAKPAVDYAIRKTYTLDYSDLETHCVRLAVRDLGISEAEVKRLTNSHATTAEALARAVAAVTPCSCSAQRSRAEAAEAALAEERAVRARVEALAERWEAATVWPDAPHRSLRGAAARLRIALSGESDPATGDDRG